MTKEVFFFSNGNTGVLADGGQVSQLQESWLLLFVNHLKAHGWNPVDFVFHLPSGDAKVFEIEGGYNWEMTTRKGA